MRGPDGRFKAETASFNPGRSHSVVVPARSGFAILLAALALALTAIFPAAASASFTNSFSLSASTTAGGAHPELSATFQLSGSPDLKSLSMTLPQGLHVAPAAVSSPCSLADAAAGNCAPESQIGTLSATALGSLTASGQLYMTAPPTSADAAGISMDLQFDGGLGSVVAQGAFDLDNLGTTQPNQTIVFGDIPHLTSTGNVVSLTDLTITLSGTVGSPPYPLVTNPSTCPATAMVATSVVTAVDNTTAQASAAYPATDCNLLPFAPTFDEVFTNPNAGAPTNATFTVDLPLGSSSLKRLALKLAPDVWTNFSATGEPSDMCPTSSLPNPSNPIFNPTNCPSQAQIGSVSLTTPLVAAPVTGALYIVHKSPIPAFGIALQQGAIGFFLGGYESYPQVDVSCNIEETGWCQTQISVTLSGLPEMPVTNLQIAFGHAGRVSNSGYQLSSEFFNFAPAGDSSCVSPSNTQAITTPYNGAAAVTIVDAVGINGCGGAADPPETILDSAPLALTNDATPSFAFSSADSTATFECKLDTANYSACSSPFTVSSALADGAHRFRIRAVNAAGPDPSPIDRSFTVDATAPGAPTLDSVPLDPSTSVDASFAFTGESGASFSCVIDGGLATGCSSPASYTALSEGVHLFTVTQTDGAGNESSVAGFAWTIDSVAPAAPTISTSPASPTAETEASIEFTGEPGGSFECKLDQGAFAPCASPKAYDNLAAGQHSFSVRQTDLAGNVGTESTTLWEIIPVNEPTPIDQNGFESFADQVDFLYTGANPVQTGVAPGAIEQRRIAVVRGKVIGRDNQPLPGVTVAVIDHPELGVTTTDATGEFAMAVNGGGAVTVRYTKEDYLSAERVAATDWHDYAWVDDTVLVALSPQVTTVDLTGPLAPAQVAQGPIETDQDGSRRATLVFNAGTQATMEVPGTGTVPLSTLNVRATEFTVGPNGREAMPAPLPPTSAYTYAVEYTVDEAITAGASRVDFSRPVISYTNNFLGVPIGTVVPSGYLDPQLGKWIADESGRVVEILSESSGAAVLDTTGSGQPATPEQLTALGITPEELEKIAEQFVPGQSFWRVPVRHFSIFQRIYRALDFNFFGLMPGDADASGGENDDKHDCDKKKSGSIIGCENQTLGESIPVTGTGLSLNYTSRRAAGYKSSRTIDLALTRSQISDKLRAIHIEVSVAGQQIESEIAPQPNARVSVTWDGKDGFGREVNGSRAATVRLGYEYEMAYGESPAFGLRPQVDLRTTLPWGFTGRGTLALEKVFKTRVGSFDPAETGLGGWTLDAENHYDSETNTLMRGNGTQRTVESVGNVIYSPTQGVKPIPPTGAPCLGPPNNTPLSQAYFCNPRGVAGFDDGTLMVADSQVGLVNLTPDGFYRQVPGFQFVLSGSTGYPFCGQPIPSNVQNPFLRSPTFLVKDKAENVYVLDDATCIVWKRTPAGQVSRVTGGGSNPTPADGSPAVDAIFGGIGGIALGPDDSLYFSDIYTRRIFQITPDGLLRKIAGNGQHGFTSDGEFVYDKGIDPSTGITVGQDGSVYFVERWYLARGPQVRKITPGGVISTVAGEINPDNYGCDSAGRPATDTKLYSPQFLYTMRDGSILINDCVTAVANRGRLRKLTPEGTLVDVAGSDLTLPGVVGLGDGGPPQRAYLTAWTAAELANGDIAIAGGGNARVIRGKPDKLGSDAFSYVPSVSGDELYVFDAMGRQMRTLDTKTNATIEQFARDAQGRLLSIADGDGNTTTVHRDGAGNPTSIEGPFGRTTQLTLNAAGRLAAVEDPLGNANTMTYHSGDLLASFGYPRGGQSTFTYDGEGRLTGDSDRLGSAKTLSRESQFVTDPNNPATLVGRNDVLFQTQAGRTTRYRTANSASGAYSTSTTEPNGLTTTTTHGRDGGVSETTPDGTRFTSQKGPDPRFGMQAPVVNTARIETPAGKTLTASHERTATQANLADPSTLTALVEKFTVNGKITTDSFDPATRTYTNTSPSGRTSSTAVDVQQRPLRSSVPGLTDVESQYDARGRLITATQGARQSSFTYNLNGDLASATDPAGRVSTFDYDTAGRLTAEHLPGGRTVAYAYDQNGNVTSVTPPSRPAHGFSYNLLDMLSGATAPDVGSSQRTTTYEYATPDHDLTKISRPSGAEADLSYDSAGRVTSVTSAEGAAGFTYSAQTGHLSSASSPDNENLSLTYDGPLVTSQTLTGPVSGTVGLAYNNDLLPASMTTAGATTSYSYDADNLLASAGDLALTRDPQNGLLTGTSLANVATTRTYNTFAEPVSELSTAAGSEVLHSTYTRDALGRITTKQEVTPSKTTTWTYNYDPSGRLENVLKNGNQYAEYSYDANGNKTSQTVDGQATYATFDNQDRMNTFGNLDLTYNANGELTEKRDRVSEATKNFTYSTLGDLTGATTADGRQISYLRDAAGNRVGKKIDGQLTEGYLYASGMLGPVAMQDSTGNTTARFIYATHVNVPDYIVKNGATYRVITDQLGSVRMVVNASSGAIAQEIEYGPFGEITSDSNPGFQPFGFAGGLFDNDTGLTHFGAREYDAELGRWSASDPIGFNGGDSNLYGYVLGDPVNFVDPSGLIFGIHFDMPSVSEVATRYVGFVDGVTFGFTNWVRDRLGLQGGLDRCSLDYRVAYGIGGLTAAVEAGVVTGGVAGFALAEAGAGAFVSALGVGAASGLGETVVANKGTPTTRQLATGIGVGAMGGISGDFVRGSDAANTVARESAAGTATSYGAGGVVNGFDPTAPGSCGC